MSIDSIRTAGPLAAALVLALTAPAALAEPDPVGRALAARGGVTADRAGASSRGLGRGDPVYEGDVIRTSARGRVQLRLQDGAMVDLEPSSRFEIDTYAGDEGDGNVVMSFLRGAMRTITGAIGGGDGESYEVQTSVATIGVRGTAYALRYCDAACVDEGGDPGIYGRVDEGEIVARGPGGEFVFGAGEYFFLPETGDPRRVVVPPDGVLDGGDDGGGGSGPEGTEEAPIRPVEGDGDDDGQLSRTRDDLFNPDYESGEDIDLGPLVPDQRPGTTVDASFSGAFLGSSGFAVFESPGDAEARIDDEGRIVGAEFEGFGFFDASGLSFDGEGTTTVTDAVTESALFDVTWGSWSADSLPVEDGEPAGLLYAFADPQRFTQADQLQEVTGLVGYFDLGGPPLLANDGTQWEVGNILLGVDFNNSEIDVAEIGLEQIATEDIVRVDAGFGGDPAASIGSDGSFSVTGLQGGVVEGDTDYAGDLSGRFLGQGADGALIAFEVREVDGERRIIGTRILGASGGSPG